jgi:hypothetical protein
MKHSCIITLAALGVIASAAHAYDVNKDLQNIGSQSAYDLAVVLSGQEQVTGHFDGYSGRRFGSFSSGPSGANTLLRWQNVIEPGGNGAIDPGEIVHVGWTTADHSSHVLDMYWTDQSGNRIPGSRIFNVTSGWTYDSGVLTVSWANIFVTDTGEVFPIQISDLAVAVFANPWPLEELNAQNDVLSSALQPLPAGGTFVVPPDQPVILPLPIPVPAGSSVVLRYGVTGPGDSAVATDWIQIIIPPPLPPSTYFVNKDLQNIGTQPAYDLVIVLAGQQTITDHYDGYPVRHFGSFSTGPSGLNTLLHWQNLNEPGGDGAIDPGEVVHVGWGTVGASHVLDMYWTDQSGNRIPGSRIFNITSGWTYDTGILTVSWTNIFVTDIGEVFPIQISDVSMAVFADPWPLSELNAQNDALAAALVPVPGGTFAVAPDQTVTLALPESVPAGSAVVLRYGATGPGGSAVAIDYIQIIVPPPPPPPTSYFVNKDLQNIGTQPAYDLVIVLPGPQTILSHYDGYSNRRFGSFSTGPSGSNTLLHWQNLIEPGGDGAIDPGEVVHVGWGTSSPSQVLDMYWTDQSGNRIPGSKIFNITSGWTYETSFITLSWTNIFVAEGAVFPIQITGVSAAVFANPWPLSELNAQNDVISGALVPLSGGSFVVAPDETMTLTMPSVPPGSAVVLRYQVTGPGDDADAMDFVQLVAPERPCTATGDANCDGAVNTFDIDPFVIALTNPTLWQATYPCDYLGAADCNHDGSVNTFDIDPFVLCLTVGCP